MTKLEIQKMQLENIALKSENKHLIEEQKEFQEALKKQVDRIKNLGAFKRFFGAVQLVIDLIVAIESGFKK